VIVADDFPWGADLRFWADAGRGVDSASAGGSERLQAAVADRKTPQHHVWRAGMVLMTADGAGTMAIRAATGTSRRMLAEAISIASTSVPVRTATPWAANCRVTDSTSARSSPRLARPNPARTARPNRHRGSDFRLQEPRFDRSPARAHPALDRNDPAAHDGGKLGPR
jgi:hypothetical protein